MESGSTPWWVTAIVGVGTPAIIYGFRWAVHRGRQRDQANARATDAEKRLEIRSFESMETAIKNCEERLRLAQENFEKAETRHGETVAKMGRKLDRMMSFTLELFGVYLQAKAYIATMEGFIVAMKPDWVKQEIPDLKLPKTFDDPPTVPGHAPTDAAET